MVLKGGRMETTVWAGKLLVVCVGIVSTMVFFKVVIIPYLLNLAVSTLPHLWTSITASCCLSPLYIYIILNFIILIIAASSTLQKHPSNSSVNNLNSAKTSTSTSTSTTDEHDYDGTAEYNSNKMESRHSENATISPLPSLLTHQFSNEMISWHDIRIIQQASTEFEEHQQEEFEEPGPVDPSPELAAEESCLAEKPVTTVHVEEVIDREDNTLDTTWNAIMERQGKPVCKHLKKSETWDTPPRTTGLVRSSIIPAREFLVDEEEDHYQETITINSNVVDDRVAWARKELKKSETFSDRVSMIREKSMSQEELKQRAEAFINKINNQMRLQRLESDQRFRDMFG